MYTLKFIATIHVYSNHRCLIKLLMSYQITHVYSYYPCKDGSWYSWITYMANDFFDVIELPMNKVLMVWVFNKGRLTTTMLAVQNTCFTCAEN